MACVIEGLLHIDGFLGLLSHSADAPDRQKSCYSELLSPAIGNGMGPSNLIHAVFPQML